MVRVIWESGLWVCDLGQWRFRFSYGRLGFWKIWRDQAAPIRRMHDRESDCAACRSIPGEPSYSGGLRTPVGAIHTTNITPDPIHRIGRFSLADFDRALRFGVANGHTLYPAMPFTSYYNTTPEDVGALYAYFRQGVPAAAAFLTARVTSVSRSPCVGR